MHNFTSKDKCRDVTITKEELIAFEDTVANEYKNAKIRGPVHLSSGNEDYLIDLFQYIQPHDWVFSTWRNHFHALLHGVPKDQLLSKIMDSQSISFQSPEHNFYTSAIVGGILPIATGVALALKLKSDSNSKVWCFVGDMAAESGTFYEAVKYSILNKLPIHFIIEDNNLSTNTPTSETWGGKIACDFFKEKNLNEYVTYYSYTRNKYPHTGVGEWIHF